VLLASGVGVDSVNESGATALYMASQTGRAEIVKMLIANNVDVNRTITAERLSPLWVAAQQGHAQVVRQLLAAGATIDEPTTIAGMHLSFARTLPPRRTRGRPCCRRAG